MFLRTILVKVENPPFQTAPWLWGRRRVFLALVVLIPFCFPPTPLRAEQTDSRATCVLSDGFVRCTVELHSGRVRGVNLARGDQPILGEVCDLYEVQEAGKPQAKASEAEDRVQTTRRRGSFSIILTCANPRLEGVTLEKQFTLDHGVVTKTVRVSSRATEARLLLVDCLADPLHLTSASGDKYGFDLPFGYYPENLEPIFWMDKWGSSVVRIQPAFVYPQLGVTVGVHLLRINGRFVYARETDAWVKAGDKLKLVTMAADFIGQGRAFSYEYQIRTVRGDALDYYRSYQTLAGYRQLMSDQNDPKWFDRVRFVTDCGPMDLLPNLPEGQALPPVLRGRDVYNVPLGEDSRDVVLWTMFGWGTLGQLPTEGQWLTYEPRGYPMSVEKMLWCRDSWLRRDPRRKMALYDWNRSFALDLSPFKEHPEWAARDAKGNPCQSFVADQSYWPRDAMPNYTGRIREW